VLEKVVDQRVRYVVAVEAVADWVVAKLDADEASPEDFMEAALEELRWFESAGSSEHLWIFRDPTTLHASDRVFEALEERTDGRDWFHADLTSAIAAVARYDVMSELAVRIADWVDDVESEDGVVVKEGEA